MSEREGTISKRVTELTTADRELISWPLVGREVRAGTWAQQAESTLDRIDKALAEARLADASVLVEHLLVETQEVYDLLHQWSEAIVAYLMEHKVPRQLVTEAVERIMVDADWDGLDPVAERALLADQVASAAAQIRAGVCNPSVVQPAVETWTRLHDRLLILVAGLIDVVSIELGEAQLGDVWEVLQAEGIVSYDRYSTARNPWDESFARLVQIALEGMHAHFGGPRRRGEVTLEEYKDRIDVSFDPCGSGGRLAREGLYGKTVQRYPFAWNEVGVCHYCIHCCVLQQLEPIKRNGYPGRVIDPPREGRDQCTWTVYRDPALVPDEAYLRVGQMPPERER